MVEFMSSIAVIGGGKIGEALIVGLINGGINPKNIHVTNREPERNQYLRDKYAVLTFDDNILAVDGADVVFLCVKPKVVASVVEEISDRIDNNEATTVVSMAAGISIAVVEEGLAAGAPVIRVIAQWRWEGSWKQNNWPGSKICSVWLVRCE